MKMKKTILLFSMLAVFSSLTACGSGEKEVTFDYNNADIIYSTVYEAYQLDNVEDAYRAYLENSEKDNEMAEVLLQGIANFDSAKEECGNFKGYESIDGNRTVVFDFARLNAQDEDAYAAASDDLKEFLSSIDADIEENSNGNVVVKLTAVYDKRDVEYDFVYEENPEAAYSYELMGQNVAPYKVKEITATPEYTTGEKMRKAAANTLMGMGTVFAVLILIAVLIAQFGRIGKLAQNKKNKKTGQTAEPVRQAAPQVVETADENLVDDGELVAVITAAIAAATAGAAGGSTTNGNGFIVRSIRKAKRS